MLGRLKLVFITSAVCMFGLNVCIGGLGLFVFEWGGISLVYGFSIGVWTGWVVYVITWARFQDWESVKLNTVVVVKKDELLDHEETRDLEVTAVSKIVSGSSLPELEQKLIG